MTSDRTFDYLPRLDDRNLPYRLTPAPGDLHARPRYWTPGPVLDQGREGACVGFGCTAEALASPVRVKFPGWQPAAVARDTYHQARRIDEWEGEAYEGTSVRAGMLVGRERGWWTGFRWALNMGELRAALELGPVVIGVQWMDAMYDAFGGLVDIAGDPVGGHCLLLTGYSPNWKRRGPHYRWRNSWGGGPDGYGVNGSAYIRAADLNTILFQTGGEAAVPVGRK